MVINAHARTQFVLRYGRLWDAFTCTRLRFPVVAVTIKAVDTRYCCITASFSVKKSHSNTSSAVQGGCAMKHWLGFPRAAAVWRTSPTSLHRAAFCRQTWRYDKFFTLVFPEWEDLLSGSGCSGCWLENTYGPIRSFITVQSLVTWSVPPELSQCSKKKAAPCPQVTLCSSPAQTVLPVH